MHTLCPSLPLTHVRALHHHHVCTGNSIAVIENLAATQDQFDSIDLSDNEIRKVECMAVLRRLTQLLLSNNRVTRISESIGRALPKLQTLVLTNNELRTLAELEPLRHVPTLTALSLVDNPVTKVEHYRLYVISLLPKLKVLDFQRVRPAERDAALTRFGRAAQPHDTGAGGPMRRGGRGAAAAPAGGDSLADAAAAAAATTPSDRAANRSAKGADRGCRGRSIDTGTNAAHRGMDQNG